MVQWTIVFFDCPLRLSVQSKADYRLVVATAMDNRRRSLGELLGLHRGCLDAVSLHIESCKSGLRKPVMPSRSSGNQGDSADAGTGATVLPSIEKFAAT